MFRRPRESMRPGPSGKAWILTRVCAVTTPLCLFELVSWTLQNQPIFCSFSRGTRSQTQPICYCLHLLNKIFNIQLISFQLERPSGVRPVTRLQGLRGQNNLLEGQHLCFIVYLKQFLGTKNLGTPTPNTPCQRASTRMKISTKMTKVSYLSRNPV